MGDDDPLDVCEIGSENSSFTAQVKPVKILGALAVIDQRETDWKILAIDVKDPLASKIHGPTDIDSLMPGLLDSMKYWFTVYKIPEGKAENGIGLQGVVKDRK
jgi:inorganic pyrophosphatase